MRRKPLRTVHPETHTSAMNRKLGILFLCTFLCSSCSIKVLKIPFAKGQQESICKEIFENRFVREILSLDSLHSNRGYIGVRIIDISGKFRYDAEYIFLEGGTSMQYFTLKEIPPTYNSLIDYRDILVQKCHVKGKVVSMFLFASSNCYNSHRTSYWIEMSFEKISDTTFSLISSRPIEYSGDELPKYYLKRKFRGY